MTITVQKTIPTKCCQSQEEIRRAVNRKKTLNTEERRKRGLERDRRNAVRDAEHKDKAKPNHEETPKGYKEKAKRIVAAEQRF